MDTKTTIRVVGISWIMLGLISVSLWFFSKTIVFHDYHCNWISASDIIEKQFHLSWIVQTLLYLLAIILFFAQGTRALRRKLNPSEFGEKSPLSFWKISANLLPVVILLSMIVLPLTGAEKDPDFVDVYQTYMRDEHPARGRLFYELTWSLSSNPDVAPNKTSMIDYLGVPDYVCANPEWILADETWRRVSKEDPSYIYTNQNMEIFIYYYWDTSERFPEPFETEVSILLVEEKTPQIFYGGRRVDLPEEFKPYPKK